jgi:hypothetical protein
MKFTSDAINNSLRNEQSKEAKANRQANRQKKHKVEGGKEKNEIVVFSSYQ